MILFPDSVLMVFCKAPVPGQVKTRLIPSLTEHEAAQLHCELTQKTLQIAVTHKQLCEVQLWCTPVIEHPFFDGLARTFSVNKCLQQGLNLGESMHHAFCSALARFNSAIIIGCDCPSLTSGDIEQALSHLEQGKDCVLAPAEDGGYVLIGLKRPQPELFADMPWGTAQVCNLTLNRLKALGLDYGQINRQWDLDRIEDLERYRKLTISSP